MPCSWCTNQNQLELFLFFGLFLFFSFVSSLGHKTTAYMILTKRRYLLSFLSWFCWRKETDVAAWILGCSGRNDFKETHIARCFNVLPCVVLACLSNLGLGCVSTHQNSCDPLLNSDLFGLISKTQKRAIHHYLKTTLTRYSDQLLTIMTLTLAFCNSLNQYLSFAEWLFYN